MISIIICSRTPKLPQLLEENIKTTAGGDYELVVIDNSTNRYDIFHAYNEGVRRAKGDILCFAHDDILFRSDDWVPTLQRHFDSDAEVGLIGVGGTHFLSSYPIYWSLCPFISEHHLHNDHGQIITCFNEDYFPEGALLSEVVAVDGLCMFIRASLFETIHFDTDTYHGFHAYDMDICMQVIAAGKKVMVCRDAVIEHAWSERTDTKKPGFKFLDVNMQLFVKKWGAMLPIVRGMQLPEHTVYKLDQIFAYAYDSIKARRSRAYRLGKALLSPLNLLKGSCKKASV